MKIEVIPVGAVGTNCYLAYDENTNEGIVIDPGDEGAKIVRAIEKHQVKVKYIVNTHGHFDHIVANEFVKDYTKAQLLIHPLDAPMLTDPCKNLTAYIGQEINKPAADAYLEDGNILEVGTIKFLILHTPGHSQGCICLLAEKICFCGDTLFASSIGRTDLPGGSFKQLINSIKTKLLTLEDDVVCYPGHGPATTIGQERRLNPFLGEN